MKQNVEIPQVGESVTSGILAVWFKQSGEFVQEGEDLFELETDKATMPVPAPVSGVVTIKVEADEEVEVGTVVAEIDTDAQAATGTAVTGGGETAQDTADDTDAPTAGNTEKDTAGHTNDNGSGVDGKAAATGVPASGSSTSVSPAVRRVLAENELTVDEVTASVTGSGKQNRLTKADVERHLTQKKQNAPREAGPASQPAHAAHSSDTAQSAQPAQERKKMSMLRRRVAENLVKSRQESAHLSTFNEVDMSAVMRIRSAYKEQFEQRHGVRLGFMSFFLKAAHRAFQDFPAVNAFIDGDEIVYNYVYNIGVAISTDRGLIVPVVRNVETMSFAGVEAQIIDFATRAKEKRIMPDEFSGGTFTITNGGVFGSMLSTPIPSPPQTAVLGMHSIQKRAVVVDDEIVIRPMMYLALTYDHRVIDGREAIGFLNVIKNDIEDPTRLMLEL